jgi:nicotinamidase/pyrazinamidase
MTALLVIDIQNDLCEGGIMASKKSSDIISIVNRIKSKFNTVIFSMDNHTKDNISFKKRGGKYNQHCVVNTNGCKLNSFLNYDKNKDLTIIKGDYDDYDTDSCFYRVKNNNINIETNLRHILNENNIKTLYICGLGFEHCIYNTILDAYKFRINTIIIEDGISYLNNIINKRKINFIKNQLDIKFIQSNLIN